MEPMEPIESVSDSTTRNKTVNRWALLIGGLFIFALALAMVQHSSFPHEADFETKYSMSPLGDDYPSQLPIPNFQAEISVLTHESPSHFRISTDPEATAEWHSLAPDGGSFVYLGPNRRVFGVSLFHQLHCLDSLRVAFAEKEFHEEHIHHCMNVLRQAILCAGDVTLEAAGSDGRIVTGNNVTHSCRDWSKAYQRMAELHREDSDVAVRKSGEPKL